MAATRLALAPAHSGLRVYRTVWGTPWAHDPAGFIDRVKKKQGFAGIEASLSDLAVHPQPAKLLHDANARVIVGCAHVCLFLSDVIHCLLTKWSRTRLYTSWADYEGRAEKLTPMQHLDRFRTQLDHLASLEGLPVDHINVHSGCDSWFAY
jgi:hypothetical protein